MGPDGRHPAARSRNQDGDPRQEGRESKAIELPDDVRIFIATKTKSNVRELEGALVKLIAYSSLTGQPITLGMAQQVLKHIGRRQDRRITIDSISERWRSGSHYSPAS